MGRDAKKYDVFSRFTREDHTYGASRLPKTTVLQSSMYVCMSGISWCKRNTGHGRSFASCANRENIIYKAHTFSSFADPV